jgi:hypothetical protein
MTEKWRAFTIWLISPFLFYVTVVFIVSMFRNDVPVTSFSYWKVDSLLLGACAIPAVLGTFILWALPIRRPPLGIGAGSILAIAGIVLWNWFEMNFFGGFEANAGYYVTSLMLLVPSCLAGAYAGFLRTRKRHPMTA